MLSWLYLCLQKLQVVTTYSYNEMGKGFGVTLWFFVPGYPELLLDNRERKKLQSYTKTFFRSLLHLLQLLLLLCHLHVLSMLPLLAVLPMLQMLLLLRLLPMLS